MVHDSTKHLGMILDKKLNFNLHLDEKILKANKGINLIRKFQTYLSPNPNKYLQSFCPPSSGLW